jgi:hypothetical protein
VGTLTLPRGFALRAQQGTDSYPGLILRADSSLVIAYDIGAMAGARVHPNRSGAYVWLVEHEVHGHRAYTGLAVDGAQRRLATTVLGSGSEPWSLPANFEAEVHDERDVAEFMLIVSSYEPTPRSDR